MTLREEFEKDFVLAPFDESMPRETQAVKREQLLDKFYLEWLEQRHTILIQKVRELIEVAERAIDEKYISVEFFDEYITKREEIRKLIRRKQ